MKRLDLPDESLGYDDQQGAIDLENQLRLSATAPQDMLNMPEEVDSAPAPQPSVPMPADIQAPSKVSALMASLAPKAPEEDLEANYAKAQEEARNSAKSGNLLQATNALLSGAARYSGAKPDLSAANEAIKAVDKTAADKAANMAAQQKFGQEVSQNKIQKAKAKMESDDLDPNSDASQSFRKMIEANFPQVVKAYGPSWAKVAAGDKDKIFDPLKLKETIEARKEMIAARKQSESKSDLLEKKEQLKEETQEKKENRKARSEIDKTQQSAESILQDAKAAKEKFLKYSKGSVTGTGPLATLGGLTKYASQDTEALNSAFKKISMDSLVKQFAGMSKAIDSDSERRAFEATQPSITQDDKTNLEILDRQIKAAESLVAKSRAAKSQFDVHGNRIAEEPTSESLQQNQPSPETKVINGVTYQKVEGGWKKVK